MDYLDKIFGIRSRLFSFNYVPIFDILFSNYLGHDLYVHISRCKKKKLIRVAFIDFNSSNKLMKLYYDDSVCNNLIRFMKNQISTESYINKKSTKNNVYLQSYINNQTFEFTRYIPEELGFLEDFLSIVFEYLPKYYEKIFKEMVVKENHRVTYTSYYEGLDFNFFEEDIKTLFEEDEVKEGEKLYKKQKALFLEKFENRYYAVYDNDIITRIKYNNIETKLHFGCNCGISSCKHIYATLKFIKNKINLPRFYKIIDITNTHNILDILQRGEYYLCIGITNDKYKIIDSKGNIYFLPITNDNNLQFRILEDEEGNLQKLVNNYLNK